jgi:Uma2 family endonuclease
MTIALQTQSDQRITTGGTWQQFKLIQQGFSASPGVRLSYFEGTIEILMPGSEHEIFSHLIGYFLTTFLAEQGIEFAPTGAMTQEREGVVSAQADQSYCIGQSKPIPDLAIEVVFTSGGQRKLSRYQALGVPEVWFWQDGLFTLYRLQADGSAYAAIAQSMIPELANLDIALLSRCVLMGETSRVEAIRAFRSIAL